MSPLEILYAAFRSDTGIKVETDDAEKYRQALYRARKNEPELGHLGIYLSPTNPKGEIWIVRKDLVDAKKGE